MYIKITKHYTKTSFKLIHTNNNEHYSNDWGGGKHSHIYAHDTKCHRVQLFDVV